MKGFAMYAKEMEQYEGRDDYLVRVRIVETVDEVGNFHGFHIREEDVFSFVEAMVEYENNFYVLIYDATNEPIADVESDFYAAEHYKRSTIGYAFNEVRRGNRIKPQGNCHGSVRNVHYDINGVSLATDVMNF